VAAFLAPSLTEEAFPGRELVPALPVAAALSAWGLRHAPRIGGALVAVTLAASLWLLAAARVDGDASLAPPEGALPWAGLGLVVAAAVAATIVFLLGRELLRERELR
jgi:drug/metabolite transporter (DMT)-like permease